METRSGDREIIFVDTSARGPSICTQHYHPREYVHLFGDLVATQPYRIAVIRMFKIIP